MDKALSFKDVFKNSFLALQNTLDLTIVQILMAMVVTLIISMFIVYIYRITFDGIVYSHSFTVSLVLLSLVTAVVITTISSNIVLSLGMVGALSIVRFRAAIKDPKDIVFQFWAISVGISVGASLYLVSIVSSLFIGGVLVVLAKNKFNINTYLLIVKYNKAAKEEVLKITAKSNAKLKSKTCIGTSIEETFEVKNVQDNTSYVEILSSIDGVESAVLVKYSGDYAE